MSCHKYSDCKLSPNSERGLYQDHVCRIDLTNDFSLRKVDLVQIALFRVECSTEKLTRRLLPFHGCQMVIARLLDCMCLALWLEGLWPRYSTLQNLILSLDCGPRPPPWRNSRKGRDQILPSGNTALNH